MLSNASLQGGGFRVQPCVAALGFLKSRSCRRFLFRDSRLSLFRIIKTLALVNSTPDFVQQPQVINGFSELMVQVFGEDAGKGARSAVGMAALPSNIAVEIEAIFEIL